MFNLTGNITHKEQFNRLKMLDRCGLINHLLKASLKNEDLIVFVKDIESIVQSLLDYLPLKKKWKYLEKLYEILNDRIFDSYEGTSDDRLYGNIEEHSSTNLDQVYDEFIMKRKERLGELNQKSPQKVIKTSLKWSLISKSTGENDVNKTK